MSHLKGLGRSAAALAITAGLLAVAGGSRAAPTIPDASYEAYLFDDTAPTPISTGYFTPGTFNGYAFGVERVVLGAVPAPSIVATVAGEDGYFDAFGRITYYGMVVAPHGSPDVIVPLSVAYSVSGGGTQAGTAYDVLNGAEIQIGGNCLDAACHLFFNADATGLNAPTSFSQSGALHTEVLSGDVFGTILSAEARLDCHLCQDLDLGGGAGAGSSTLNAVWAIDPAFLAANPGYSLVFSAAPEPATWAMLLSGLGLAGGAMRRRRSLGLTA